MKNNRYYYHHHHHHRHPYKKIECYHIYNTIIEFKYFVNKFRVQEFQELVVNGLMKNFTLFGVAQKCGFKNKSTFHSVVSKHLGQSPKETYKKLTFQES